MSLAAALPAAIVDTVLGRLALLFLASVGGDLAMARQAALQMLAGHHPETENELRLAAEIVSFSFHALEALSQASAADLTLAKILRLRGCAVSLSREAHKSQRKLDQLQRERRAGVQPPSPAETEPANTEPAPSRPQIDKAIALIEATRQVIETTGKPEGKTWTQSYQQRLAAKRIAENLKKNQANHAAASAAAAASDPTSAASA